MERMFKRKYYANLAVTITYMIRTSLGGVLQGKSYSACQTRSIEQITENGTILWSTLYEQYIEEINNDAADLLSPAVDNEEEINIEEDDLEDIKEEYDEYRAD